MGVAIDMTPRWDMEEPPDDVYPDEDPYSQPSDEVLYQHDLDRAVRRLRIQREARHLVDADGEEAPPFDAGTLADILARPAEPPFRIDHLIPADASSLVIAQRKTGKTTFNLNLARCLLTGEDFLARFGVRPVTGDIAILNFEVSAAQLARWADENHVPADRLYLVNLRGRRNPLTHPEDRQALAEQLKARGIEAVMVDPFGRAYTGTNQNDAGEVGSWLVSLDQFVRAEVGARDLILSAHAGWNGERTRGSSALEDWADVVITMTKDDAEDGDGQRYLRAFGRDVDLDEDRLDYDYDTRQLTLSGEGSRRAGRTSRANDALDRAVLDAITANPGIGTSDLYEAVREAGHGLQKGDERKSTKRLVEVGKVRFETRSRGAKHYFPVTYPDVPRPTPPGDLTTYPDPSLKVGVGGVGHSGHHLPRDTCTVCQQPMALVEPGQTTHPGCERGPA